MSKTLSELTIKLKNDLINATDNNFNNINMWLTIEDIHKIRMGVDHINDSSFNKEDLSFFETCVDFNAIYLYFYHSNEAEFNQYYLPLSEINRILGPLSVYFLKHDYEVMIKKIVMEENLSFIPKVYDLIEQMEDAYNNGDFGTVTTLSSTILQNVFIEICNSKGVVINKKDKFNVLYSKVKPLLKIDPMQYNDDSAIRKFCSKLNELIIDINEIRNIYSDSHGANGETHILFSKISKHHFKLIVDTTKSCVNFLIGSYELQNNEITI
ncbi:MAG: abortive infection family protein [Coprobacillus sp.]